ncbi:MAG: calcium-binding protein [Rhizobiaceae bacterium]
MPLSFWNAQQTANVTITNLQGLGNLAQLSDGSMVLSWTETDDLTFSKVKFQKFDVFGNKVGNEQTIVGSIADSNSKVIGLANGEFAIVNHNSTSGVVMTKFNAAGVAISTPLPINFGVGNFSSNYEYVALPNGDIAFTYASNGRIYATLVSAGIVQNPILLAVAGEVGSSPDIAYANGNFLVTYFNNTTGRGETIYLRGGLAATPILGGFLPQNFTPIGSSASERFFAPSVVALSDGNFLVTQGQTFFDTDIAGMIFRNPTNFLYGFYDGGFRVNSTILGDQTLNDTVALADGKFMVAYTSTVGTNSVTSLFCQMFSPNGTPIGSEIRLSSTLAINTTLIQLDMQVLADGRVAITWTDTLGAATGAEVVMRIVDPREGYFAGTNSADRLIGNNGGNDYFEGNGGVDTVFGLGGNDTIHGGIGGDVIYGGYGDDLIYGDADNDTIVGGVGGDYMNGGLGVDLAYYLDSRGAITVNLATNVNSRGDAEEDELIGIENVYGTNAVAGDSITGDGQANILFGFTGNDYLGGGVGNDTLSGGAGADFMDGGAGADTAYYLSSTIGVRVNLLSQVNTGGEAAGDTLIGVENVIGSNLDADILVGNALANSLFGYAGNDSLNGFTGNDTLVGGAGADAFYFNSVLSSSANLDTISDFVAADDTVFLENAIFTTLTTVGALSATAFKDLATGVADANDRILYATNGVLLYDADGSGAGAAVAFALLSGRPVISAADFYIF